MDIDLIQMEVVESIPFGHEWVNTDPANTHRLEELISSILNTMLLDKGMRCYRIPHDMYSDTDIEVITHNLKNLKDGPVVCRIDCEQKPKITMSKNEIPDTWWRGVSFLKRKTDKELNTDRDIYFIFGNSRINKNMPCIWCTYGNIREYGLYEKWNGFGNEFLVIRDNAYKLLQYDLKTLVSYCEKLKNREVTA